jgi:hypothetical protein
LSGRPGQAAFAAALPLARGPGVEVGLAVDLLRQEYQIQEVGCPSITSPGTDWQSQVHRGRQWLHVAWALAHGGRRFDCRGV